MQLFSHRGKTRKSKKEVKQEIIRSIIERKGYKTNVLDQKADKVENCDSKSIRRYIGISNTEESRRVFEKKIVSKFKVYKLV